MVLLYSCWSSAQLRFCEPACNTHGEFCSAGHIPAEPLRGGCGFERHNKDFSDHRAWFVWHLKMSPGKQALPGGNEMPEMLPGPCQGGTRHRFGTLSAQGLKKHTSKKRNGKEGRILFLFCFYLNYCQQCKMDQSCHLNI